LQFQRTICSRAEESGIGLHSAVPVRIRLLPGAANQGIVFRRTDLDGFEISASWKHIARVSYATSLMKQGVLISTTEHLLAGLYAMGVDNAVVEINSLELPILDGSSAPFINLVKQAGVRRQRARQSYLRLLRPVEVTDGSKRIAVFPHDGFRVTSSIDFPHPMIGRQTLEFDLTPEVFEREIASARTFGFLDEIPQMKDMGLIRGGSLANALVFTRDGLMNPEGLRFPDECCRHKVLDLIGDLALIGYPLRAHVVAERAGHAMHTALVLKLVRDRSLWELVSSDEPVRAAAPPAEPVAVGHVASD
jgi:UDP-3-O-[3-hydroxymyristoyl] N-acetylglucosamine deacetylase